MADDAGIWSWHPGSGRVEPLRYRGWWVQYPQPSCAEPQLRPGPDQRPVFREGDVVWLRGKPDRPRRVLAVEWHMHRYQFVYVVQTSAPSGFRPYWFAPQLSS